MSDIDDPTCSFCGKRRLEAPPRRYRLRCEGAVVKAAICSDCVHESLIAFVRTERKGRDGSRPSNATKPAEP